MEFFDKLRLTLSSPLKSHSSDSRDFKTWTLPVQNFKNDSIRLLLYRDSDRGRKCLFDSAHVLKDTKTGKFQYLPVSNIGQVKDLSEWIFGCVPLSSTSTKRFHRWKGNYIWSKTFQAPATIRNRNSNSTCRNVYSGSSSCLSSNGDLTSSGYVSSGIDDSSYDQSSTDSSRNWSLPIMNPNAGSETMKMSNSLPSRLTLEMPSSKILLGLAIVISTGDDDDDYDDDDKDKSREICDRKQLPTYITCISSTLELSTDWFSMISIQSHLNPPNFVETMYNFSEEFRQMFHFRLTTPLANINNIPLTMKYLPSSIGEFLTVYMTNDLSWTKCYPLPKRCRIVIMGNPKKIQEVKSIFTLLKLINQCSCTKSVLPPLTPPPISNTLSSSISQEGQEQDDNKVQQQQPPPPSCPNTCNNYSSNNDVSLLSASSSSSSFNNLKIPTITSSASSSSAAITICIKTSEESPTKDEIGLDAVNYKYPESLTSEDFMKKPDEDSKFLTRESTKDSGISSILSSTTSLKRSSTSRKFVGNLPSSIDSLDSGKNNLETVYFHLGEESDNEQTFNNLGLSEPNIEKLKPHCNSSSNTTILKQNSNAFNISPALNTNTNISSHLIFESGSEGSSSNSNKISPVNFNNESLEENYDSFDMLEDVNNILSNSSSSNNFNNSNISNTPPIREPISVELSNVSTTKLKIVKFCTYCDSISIVEKFNPLFQIQWLKCSSNNNNNNSTTTTTSNNTTTTTTTTTSTSQLDNIIPGDSFKYIDENWIIYNLDRHIIKFFDGNTKQETNLSANPPSDLVKNLIEHVQVLMNNSKESEIEQFINIQLDFIKKLGEDFGNRLMQVTKFDVQSMPYVGENDLNLLFAIATSQFHELNQRFFV